jgi:hypothetical protein
MDEPRGPRSEGPGAPSIELGAEPGSFDAVTGSRPEGDGHTGGERSEPAAAFASAPLTRPMVANWATRAAGSGFLQSPVQVGTAVVVVAGLFTVLRVLVAAHGNVGGLVLAGSRYVSVTRYSRGLPVQPGTGYDGQFYYRLALDPLDWSRRAFGIELDNLGRVERVTYPGLVWLISADDASAVPVVMVLVNVVALGVLAGVCTAMSREARRHPLWGLLIAGFWGFLWTLSRDLTELTEAVFLVAGLLAIRKARPVLAGVLLSAAVLAREPALIVVGAIFVARVWVLFRPGSGAVVDGPGTGPSTNIRLGSGVGLRSGRFSDVAWALPLVVFTGWQLAVRVGTGSVAMFAPTDNNVGLPFDGLVHGIVHYLELLPHKASLEWGWELAVLALIGTLAALSLRTSTAQLHERIAWVASAILTLMLANSVWLGDVGFRSVDDFYLLSGILVLFSGLRLTAAAWLVALTWSAVAIELVVLL